MDIYNVWLNDELEKMSNEDFLKLVENFEKEASEKNISVEEQKKIKEILKNEADKRKISRADLYTLIDEKNTLFRKIEEAYELLNNDGFISDFLNRDSIEKFVSDAQIKIEQIDKKIEEIKQQETVSKQASLAAKKTKFTIINKRLDNGKKAICSVPQRICSLSKSNLGKMYKASKKIYKKVNEGLNERAEKIELALNELFEDSDKVAYDYKLNNAQKFIKQQDILKKSNKLYKKYKKVERAGNLLGNLKTGIIRNVIVPTQRLKAFLEKGRQEKEIEASTITI